MRRKAQLLSSKNLNFDMRYTLSSLSRKTRLLIMLILLVATLAIPYTDFVPHIIGSLSGGFFIGMFTGEVVNYFRQNGWLKQPGN